MLTKEQLEFYEENGYMIIDSLHSESLDEVTYDIWSVFKKQLKRYNIPTSTYRYYAEVNYGSHKLFELFNINPAAVKGCGKAIQNLPSVYKLMIHKQILSLVSRFIKEPVVATKPVVFFHHPKLAESEIYWKIPPHQDQASMQQSANSIVAWIPLVDCLSKDIGPLEVIPGSHKKGAQWTKFQDFFGICENVKDEDFVPIYCAAGSLILFSSMLIHRSGTNISDRIRYSINFRYSDLSDENWIDRDYHNPYIYKSIVENDYRPAAEVNK